MTRYFSYGANMDPVHMARQCPNARPLGRAILPDHRFGIAQGGFGTAVPSPGSVLHGFLWSLGPADLEALDRFEGVPGGFYHRTSLQVVTAEGERISAMAYQPADSSPGAPAAGYLERIIEVAELLGFPQDYRDELRGLLALR